MGCTYLYAWFMNFLICRCAVFGVLKVAINCTLQAENFSQVLVDILIGWITKRNAPCTHLPTTQ
jgi:hypothetical protein